jgi:hypothetical protein
MLACTDTWPHFLANLERTGVHRLVRPLRATSAAGAAATAGPVRLLFVDGSHELADVRTDIACWFPRLAPGALVAFHDSWHMQGVRQATSELLRTRAGLRAPRLVDTITALTCTGTDAPAPGHRAFRLLRWLRGPAGFLRLTWRGTRLTPVGPAVAS